HPQPKKRAPRGRGALHPGLPPPHPNPSPHAEHIGQSGRDSVALVVVWLQIRIAAVPARLLHLAIEFVKPIGSDLRGLTMPAGDRGLMRRLCPHPLLLQIVEPRVVPLPVRRLHRHAVVAGRRAKPSPTIEVAIIAVSVVAVMVPAEMAS